MKQAFKRILSFLLSICIIVASAFLYPVSSYAVYDPDTSWWEKFLEESSTYLVYLASRVGAVVDHDFAQWWQTREDYIDWWNTGHISRLENSDGDISYSFDADLVAQIKQALQEYADEMNPFKIQKTYSYKSIPAGLFPSKQTYNEFLSYCQSHYMTAFSFPSSTSIGNERMLLGDVSEVVDDGGGFIANGGTHFYTVNSNWSKAPVWRDSYTFIKNSDGDYIIGNINEHNQQCTAFYNYNSTTATFRANLTTGYLVTKDGGRIRVFNSLAEFKDYNAGQRKVYFGKDFYDYTPADITATWDDISDTLDHMDDILQQLLDKINDSTDESTIEELLQEILDAIRNGGGGGTGGGGWIGGAVAQWYEDVLSYLDKILKQLKSIKRWTVIDTVIGGVDAIADWLDLIHDVLSDVDDGAESAVATLSDALDDATGLLKSKFPFSVPWDIFFFVTLLAADPETPHFEVPIDFDVSAIDMHIHYDFVVDFSDYKYLSDICRVVLSMTYAVGLMKMTAGIVNTKKEE